MTLMGSRRDATARAEADDGVSSLYAVHWAPMVRLAWLFVHDDLLAEEIAQDAFVALHRRWDDVQEGRGAAYLRQSVVNGARSALRHHKVEQRYLDSTTRGGHLRVASAEDAARTSGMIVNLMAAGYSSSSTAGGRGRGAFHADIRGVSCC